jgi:hypothetical protein
MFAEIEQGEKNGLKRALESLNRRWKAGRRRKFSGCLLLRRKEVKEGRKALPSSLWIY